MKKTLLVLCLFVLSAACCVAKNISVQIIQNTPGGQDRIWVTTELFEQYVIDYFFDNGQIVSNSPIWVNSSESKNRGALRAALSENLAGGMDYLVRIEIIFNSEKTMNPDAPLLDNIEKVSWKLYAVDTGQELGTGTGLPGKVTRENNNELGISQLARYVADKISISIRG